MPARMTAALQATTPPRALVTVTGLTGAASATVFRLVDGQRSPVRPAPLPLTSDADVLVDGELPFGRDVSYVVAVTRAGVTVDEATAGPVTATVTLPVLSDPIVGYGAAVTVVAWPELSYQARAAVVAVAGRRFPLVESDVLVAAASTVVLHAPDQSVLTTVRGLLAGGQVLLLRATCDGVEDAYLAVTKVTELRHGTPGRGWSRMVELEVQEVEAAALALAAVGDNLGDLHEVVPGILQDLAVRFPDDLLQVATTQLGDYR